MDHIGTQVGKKQDSALFKGRAGTHGPRHEHSPRLPVSPSRLRGRLSRYRVGHRHVVGLIMTLNFLVRPISSYNFQWRRGGVSNGFERRLSVVSMPRRLADNGLGGDGKHPSDSQYVRPLGTAPQENTGQSSVVLLAGDEGDSSRQRVHRFLGPGEDGDSLTEGVNNDGNTVSGSGLPPEELQEGLQDGQHNVIQRPSDSRSSSSDSRGHDASCDRGQEMELQLVASTTCSVNRIEDTDSRGENRASNLDSQSQRGAPSSTGNVNTTGKGDTTDQELPSYDDAVNSSSSWGENCLRPSGPSPYEEDPPPSYLEVLVESVAEHRRMMAEYLRHPGDSRYSPPVRDSHLGESHLRARAVVTQVETPDLRSRTRNLCKSRRRILLGLGVFFVGGVILIVAVIVIFFTDMRTAKKAPPSPTTNITDVL